MKLQEYLDRNNKKVSDLAGDLNLRHTVVLRWVRGKRYPRPESMQKIFEYTNGAVTPNDFFNIANDNEPQNKNEEAYARPPFNDFDRVFRFDRPRKHHQENAAGGLRLWINWKSGSS